MTLPTPLIIINFKTYETGSDSHAEHLARVLETTAKKNNAGVAIACQAADAFRLSKVTTIPLLAQHCDPDEFGPHTGANLMETLRCNGCAGTLINHSERRVSLSHITSIIAKAKRIGFITVACAKTASEAKKISMLRPDYLAIEPPQLIAGPVSISTGKPELISGAVKAVGNRSIVLAGAGVRTAQDVRISIERGAKGVILSSQIMTSSNPGKALEELIWGLRGKQK